MHTALEITLAFVGATSLMGAVKHAGMAMRSGRTSSIAGAAIGGAVGLWCWYCAVWLYLYTA